MADSDTPQAGPLSIDDALDAMEDRTPAPEVEEGEALETEAEETETPEVEEETAEETETDEQDESEAEDEGPEVYDVSEYGGISVKLADGTQTTLEDLAKGTLRQADYSRKTQKLSEASKELDSREAGIAERERQLNERAASFEEQEPDWEKMAEEDPLGVGLAQIQWSKKQQAKAQARAEADAQADRERKAFQQQTAEVALQLMPEWADGNKFQETTEARQEAALKAGFTLAEYQGSNDFRLAVLLEKAARYDAGQTKVESAVKKLSKVPKVVKPGTSVTKAEKEQAAKVAKSKRRNRAMSVDEYLSTFD